MRRTFQGLTDEIVLLNVQIPKSFLETEKERYRERNGERNGEEESKNTSNDHCQHGLSDSAVDQLRALTARPTKSKVNRCYLLN